MVPRGAIPRSKPYSMALGVSMHLGRIVRREPSVEWEQGELSLVGDGRAFPA